MQWLLYWPALVIMILVAGLRLIKILKQHLYNQIKAGNRTSVEQIRNGLFKIRMIVSVSIITSLLFTFIRYVYTFLGDLAFDSYGATMALVAATLYHTVFATTLILLAVLFNPTALGSLNLFFNEQDTTNAISDLVLNIDESSGITSKSDMRTSDYSSQRRLSASPDNVGSFEFNEKYNASSIPLVSSPDQEYK
ncbi:hypothetical protein BD408DRAFT_419268 [Parasitella parasitica]|nr:hypothetical protein BD408DRAFT_419268 [Parasitella parasitica]